MFGYEEEKSLFQFAASAQAETSVASPEHAVHRGPAAESFLLEHLNSTVARIRTMHDNVAMQQLQLHMPQHVSRPSLGHSHQEHAAGPPLRGIRRPASAMSFMSSSSGPKVQVRPTVEPRFQGLSASTIAALVSGRKMRDKDTHDQEEKAVGRSGASASSSISTSSSDSESAAPAGGRHDDVVEYIKTDTDPDAECIPSNGRLPSPKKRPLLPRERSRPFSAASTTRSTSDRIQDVLRRKREADEHRLQKLQQSIAAKQTRIDLFVKHQRDPHHKAFVAQCQAMHATWIGIVLVVSSVAPLFWRQVKQGRAIAMVHRWVTKVRRRSQIRKAEEYTRAMGKMCSRFILFIRIHRKRRAVRIAASFLRAFASTPLILPKIRAFRNKIIFLQRKIRRFLRKNRQMIRQITDEYVAWEKKSEVRRADALRQEIQSAADAALTTGKFQGRSKRSGAGQPQRVSAQAHAAKVQAVLSSRNLVPIYADRAILAEVVVQLLRQRRRDAIERRKADEEIARKLKQERDAEWSYEEARLSFSQAPDAVIKEKRQEFLRSHRIFLEDSNSSSNLVCAALGPDGCRAMYERAREKTRAVQAE